MSSIVKLRIPENLNIEEIIRENSFVFHGNKLKEEKLIFVLDALIKSRAKHRQEINDRFETKENANQYVPLSSKYLKEVVHDYNRYLNYLLAQGIILTDNHFRVGEKCRWYCFNSAYSGQKLKIVEVDSYTLKKAIRRAIEKRNEEAKKEMWGYGYLTTWWDSNKLKIDLKAAHLWIDNYEKEKIKEIDSDVSILDKEWAIKNAIDASQDFKLLTEAINIGNYRYGFSGESHRFYNPISNLKRELRTFLTYDGKPLVDIDVKNSQPFFSIALFNRSFWEAVKGEKGQILALEEISKEIFNKVKIKEYYEHIITLLKTSETCFHEDFSLNKYTKQVKEGSFYEYIQDKLEILFPKKFNTRSKVKLEVLRIFYVDNNQIYNEFYEPCLRFRDLFETVFQIFFLIKEIQGNYLPIILQRIESFLVLDIICKRISLEHPEIPLFTIHDNIITTKGNEGIVEAIMSSEIEKWIGHKAKFDCKDLVPIQEPETIETWEPIIGFEGSYEVSRIGNVRGIERKVPHSEWERTVKSKILSSRINNRGYREVRISKGGKTFTKLVHILTAEAFVPNPENKPYVNHLDGDKLNNHYLNFGWTTHSENIKHAYEKGLIIKMSKPVIDTCTGQLFSGSKEAALYLGINPNTLKGYLNGTIKKNPTCLKYAA